MTQPTSQAASPASTAASVLEEARAALDAARTGTQKNATEFAAVGDSIRATDPDADESAFAKLVARRAALQARAEALEIREGKAMHAVHAAETALAKAKERDLDDKTSALEAKIAEADAACRREAEAGEARLLALVATVRSLVEQRRELEVARCTLAGRDVPSLHSMWFGSEWSRVADQEVGAKALLSIRTTLAQRAIYSR